VVRDSSLIALPLLPLLPLLPTFWKGFSHAHSRLVSPNSFVCNKNKQTVYYEQKTVTDQATCCLLGITTARAKDKTCVCHVV
jgi:hypothetical protein